MPSWAWLGGAIILLATIILALREQQIARGDRADPPKFGD